MPDVMMALGDNYRFSIDTAAYGELRRRTEYRWAPVERVSHAPSLQYVGKGFDEIDLRGEIRPQYKGGLRQIDHMRIEAGKGKPLVLVTGRGENLGPWCIVEVEEEQSVFTFKGTPRSIEFRLRLEYYGPDKEPPGAKGTVSFIAPVKKTVGNILPDPPAFVSKLDLAKVPQVTTKDLSAYKAGLIQAGLTQQQAASTLSQAVARIRAIKEQTEDVVDALDTLRLTYADLQNGLTHDPVGTISRLLSGSGSLGSGTRAAVTRIFGSDMADQMLQLGAAFSLSRQIAEDVSAVSTLT